MGNCCSSQQTGDSEITIQTKNTSYQDTVCDSKNDSDKMGQNKNGEHEKEEKSKKSRRLKTPSKEKDSKGTNKPKSNTPGDHPVFRRNSGETAREPTSVIPSVQPPPEENIRNNKVQNDDSKQNKKPGSTQLSTRNRSAMEDVITRQPTSAIDNRKSNDSSKSQKVVQDNSKVNETQIAELKVLPPEKTTKSDSQHQKPGIILELKSNVGIETKNEETNAGSEFAGSVNWGKNKSINNSNIVTEKRLEQRLLQNVSQRNSSRVNSDRDKDGISKVQLDKGDSNVSHLIHATPVGVDDQKMIEDTELNRKQENNVNLDQGSPGQDTDSHSLAVTNHSQERVESLPVTDQSQERVESKEVEPMEVEEFQDCPEENVNGSSCYVSLDEDNGIKTTLYSTNEIQSSSSGFQECSNELNHEISSNFSSQQFEENSTNHSESNEHSTEFKSPLYNRVGKNDDASCPFNDANDLSHSSVEQMGKRKRENEKLFHARDPKGLRNLGNTCFFNSVMQNLFQTHALEDALKRMDSPPVSQQSKKKRNKNSEVHASSSKPLTAALIDFYRTPSPENVFRQICNKSPRFSGGHQQDSHELLRHLMDGLRNEEKEMSSGENPQKILTLVDQVFGGHYMTVYTCHVCTLPYHLCEPMLDISLPVTFSRDTFSNNKSSENKVDPKLEEREKEDYKEAIKTMMSRYGTLEQHKAGSDRSVEDCLRFFTREEPLDEYLCMACYNKRQNRGETELVMTEATKQTLVYNPPAILTLHLKRFEQTARGFKKANNPISFEEILDLGPFCSSWSKRVQPNQKNIWYSLYGIVVHGGSLSGGHYVAYVKARNCDIASLRGFQQEEFLNRDGITEETLVEEMKKWSQSRHQSKYRSGYKPSEGEWYYVSDSYVDKSSWEDVRKQQAYLLFYERLKNTKETKRINNPEEGTPV